MFQGVNPPPALLVVRPQQNTLSVCLFLDTLKNLIKYFFIIKSLEYIEMESDWWIEFEELVEMM